MTGKKTEQIIIHIDDIGMNGEGIAHLDGKTFFVPFTIPGEDVSAEILYYKQGIGYGKLKKVLTPSPKRVQAPCPVYGDCGGCVFQHILYGFTLEYKKNALSQILSKNAGYVGKIEDVVPSNPCYEYRNKIQLPFGMQGGEPVLGFFREGTHEVIPTEKCLLHGKWADSLIKITQDYVRGNHLTVYDEKSGKGLLRHLVARKLGGVLCVTIVANGERLPYCESYYAMLKAGLGEDISLYLSVNKKSTNVILGEQLIPLFGKPQTASVMGIEISVSPYSFFQVNDGVRKTIYEEIIKKVTEFGSSIVVDAYSGVGLLGAILAREGAQIYNIEIIPEAIEDANKLYKANGLSAENICGDSGIILPKLLKRLCEGSSDKPISVIIDPPRKGCSPEVLGAIIDASKAIAGLNLIYLSCNPPTLSRDLKILDEAFKIDAIKPYDMFSECKGLETLVFLSGRQN